MLELTSLPAREGDALWIKWGDPLAPFQMIIDMGTEAIGRSIRETMESLEPHQRKLELLVVSHIDRDHIGGVLTCLAEAEPLEGLEVDDIWFNGFAHLSGESIAPSNSNLEAFGAVQGERLTEWLRTQNWNKAFEGKPVIRESEIKQVVLSDGLKLTVLGPTQERLAELEPTWIKEVHKALEKGSIDVESVSPGLESFGTDESPVLLVEEDLEKLAKSHNGRDHSAANGSSIALLLEYKEQKILLSGDAFSEDIADAIQATFPNEKLSLDVFKLPHHGSRNNVHRELIELVDCERWLISTDGNRFKHPDAEAIARIIAYSSEDTPLISFNAPCEFNLWWDDQDWKDMYKYQVEYGDPIKGIVFKWD